MTLELSVKGAAVEHHHNAPVKRVFVHCSERAAEVGGLGHLMRQPGGGALMINIELPMGDFAPIWAALRLDRVATLDCQVIRPPAPAGLVGDDVVTFSVKSQGSLFPLFGV